MKKMKRNLIIFLIIILGLIAVYYWSSNSYSKETLKLEILGPEKVDIAENFEYIVKYKNNGQARLEQLKLIFEYPDYSIVEENLLRKDIELEDIYPGEERTYRFKARLLGKEGEARTAKASLSYSPKNLNARFESKTTFTTIIQSVPITFRFDLPSEIESSKDITFSLNYFSNIDYPLSGLSVKVEYPSDFEFVKSNPQSLESVEWEIPPLNRAEGGRIEISGKIRGGVGTEKIFRAELGSWRDGEFVLLKEVFKGVTVIKPALYITQQINGSPEYVASPGDLLHYEISFKNIGEGALTDLSLLVTLIGDSFDLTTLNVPRADYQSGDNSILWDWKRLGELQFLGVREEGRVEFWVKLKGDWPISSSEGKEVIKTRVYLSQAKEEFETKVNSQIEVIQKGYFNDEIFGNSGSIPPKAGETTTYTIIWQAKNFYNNVNDVKVKAKLAKNVRLTGLIFPEEENLKFTFDSESKEIVWEVGNLNVGKGVLNSAPNVAFQVAFTPDNSQRGQVPEILGPAEIIGEDAWTKETIRFSTNGINTRLPDDPTVENGVVQ